MASSGESDPSFRRVMNGVHTWTGVILGMLLFSIFWTGTLAVFDKEIDQWMMPAIRLQRPVGNVVLDKQRASYAAAVADHAFTWNIVLPNDRLTVVQTLWYGMRGPEYHYDNPETGEELPVVGTLAGSGFLYPFHYSLQLRFLNLGIWLVGLAGMAMMALCVSGVIIHRKIFADFFTFRPQRTSKRAVLDLHNVAGVLGLPFHFVVTLSGLVILYALYFPSGWISAYSGNLRAFNQEAFGSFARAKANQPGSVASLDAMASEVRRLWPDEKLASVTIYYPGDAAAYVEFNTSSAGQVVNSGNTAVFDAATGALLSRRSKLSSVMTAYRFMFGLHIVQFHHWTLRWLYFVLGLAGCVLIGTGSLFWLESRRRRPAGGGFGFRIVEALTIAGISGIIVATFSFFLVNRLLPAAIPNRASVEVWVFFSVWIASLVHAWLRPSRIAWLEQSWSIAVTALAAVLFNAVTTGDNLARALWHSHLHAIAGMDLLLLLGAAVAIFAARRIASSRVDDGAATPFRG
jgi:uncharacterized iron-regulated membrane protein